MEIVRDRTQEIVFHQSNFNQELLPDPACAIEQVLKARFLREWICGKFSFNSHVNNLLSICSQWMFFCSSSLANRACHHVNLISFILLTYHLSYALPTWAGVLTADLTHTVNLLLTSCFKYGLGKTCWNLSELIELVDDELFAPLNKPAHSAF